MREIEILFSVAEPKEQALRKLGQHACKGTQRIRDTYLSHPGIPGLSPVNGFELVESFRVRQKGEKTLLTWKRNHMDGSRYLYADEEEVQVESEAITKLLLSLGFRELVRIENERTTFETAAYEIVLDEVQGLGLMMEIECKDPGDRPATEVMEEMRAFVRQSGIIIGEELHLGKPELMLRKHAH